MRPSFWRTRVKAGFTDDFNILEVTVESPADEAPNPTGNEQEFLGWEGEPPKAQREPTKRIVRVNMGVLLGVVGISLGVVSMF